MSDCKVFAIAFATCLVYGLNPSQVRFNNNNNNNNIPFI